MAELLNDEQKWFCFSKLVEEVDAAVNAVELQKMVPDLKKERDQLQKACGCGILKYVVNYSNIANT